MAPELSPRPPSPDFGFTSGDVVIVTGAGSGIGRATALRAAQMGLVVSAWDLNRESVTATVEEIESSGGRGLAVTANVADAGDVERAFAITRRCGTLRHLVNNAGPASSAHLDFDEAVRVCVGSVRLMTDTWLSSGVPVGASLVNITSVAGNLVGTNPDWYPTSKAAIMGYTRHLAAYRSGEVRSNAVAPGMIDTPRLAGFAASEVGQRVLQRIPLGRMGTPDEIAWTVLFLLSPLAGYINGVLLPVDGGWTVTQ